MKYQDMKGKKEDDNGKPKSTNESIVNVELEQLSNCSRFQSKPKKETGPA